MERSIALTDLLLVFKAGRIDRETEEGTETLLCKVHGYVWSIFALQSRIYAKFFTITFFILPTQKATPY